MLLTAARDADPDAKGQGVSNEAVENIHKPLHADHFAGLLPLLESLHLSRRKNPLDVYGPEASRFIDA